MKTAENGYATMTTENGYPNVSITNEEFQYLNNYFNNYPDKKPDTNYNKQALNKFKFVVLINLITFEGIPEGFVFLLPGTYEDKHSAEDFFKKNYMEKFNLKCVCGTYRSTVNCIESNDRKFPTEFNVEFFKLNDISDIQNSIDQFNSMYPENKD